MINVEKDIVLIIPDTHLPYEHVDALKFCKAAYKEYGCTKVLSLGDFFDQYGFSSYDKALDYSGLRPEIREARQKAKVWEKTFPKLIMTLGNHDLRFSKRLSSVIPHTQEEIVDDLKNKFGYPKGWNYVNDVKLPANSGYAPCILEHGIKAPGNPPSKSTVSYSCVYGHHHKSQFLVFYSDKRLLRFNMCVGSLVDPLSIAMRYGQPEESHQKTKLGVAILYKGTPFLIPMVCDENGRWNGKV